MGLAILATVFTVFVVDTHLEFKKGGINNKYRRKNK